MRVVSRALSRRQAAAAQGVHFDQGPEPQRLLSSTSMGTSKARPDISEEHAMPFKNVEYVDDLFSKPRRQLRHAPV